MWPFKRKTQDEKCAAGEHDWVYVSNNPKAPHPESKLAAAGVTYYEVKYICRNPNCNWERTVDGRSPYFANM